MGRIALTLPLVRPNPSPNELATYVKQAEEIGVDSLWSLDRVVDDNLDSLTALAWLAGVTKRLAIGTSVLLGPLRHPVLLAKAVATMDRLSDGRLRLGLGVGVRREDYDACAISFTGRGRRLEELIGLMKSVWSGEAINHQGQFYNVEVGPVGPRPVQVPHPPLWLGGRHPRALQRAIRLGDGYIGSGFLGPTGFRQIWSRLLALAQASNRDLQNGCLAYVVVNADARRAREVAQAALTRHYGHIPLDIDEAAVVGTPSECAKRVRDFFQAGVKTLILVPLVADTSILEFIADHLGGDAQE